MIPSFSPGSGLQGQLTSLSPSKALPLAIAIPPANSPNKFLPRGGHREDLLQPQGGAVGSSPVDALPFLSSLGDSRARTDSGSTDNDQDSSFARSAWWFVRY